METFNQLKTYHNFTSRKVKIGKVEIGGNNPILVQSMTNTNTLDTEATVEQTIRLANAGCDIVRITAPGIKEAENLKEIKSELHKKGVDIPIVADIHFNPKAAEVAAKYVEKIRINPGNYVDRNRGKVEWTDQEIEEARERIAEKLIPLLKICQEHNTAIRIGTNHGSLSERILSTYGNTARGMVESAMEFVRICNQFGFHDLVLSMKASNVKDMTAANLLLVEEMIKEGFYYPIHLGVTEAGNGDEARIKSAAGIGSLLARGIGDTVRVSLAEMPVEEVPVGKKLVEFYGRKPTAVDEILSSTNFLFTETTKPFIELTGVKYPVVSSKNISQAELCFGDGKDENNVKNETSFVDFSTLDIDKSQSDPEGKLIVNRNYNGINEGELLLKSAVDFSLLFADRKSCGIWIENGKTSTPEHLAELSLKILQGLGLRFSKAEFVACPSCGRTKFNLFDSFNKVKEKTAHLQGLQIAVMGCIVNGPGEMGDADYGYVGAGPGKVTLYKSGKAILKNIDEEFAVDALVNLIKEGGDWLHP
jgi:(E)-4-hydroxy-3-methylbut-2-enyl-diphosphate synthase